MLLCFLCCTSIFGAKMLDVISDSSSVIKTLIVFLLKGHAIDWLGIISIGEGSFVLNISLFSLHDKFYLNHIAATDSTFICIHCLTKMLGNIVLLNSYPCKKHFPSLSGERGLFLF